MIRKKSGTLREEKREKSIKLLMKPLMYFLLGLKVIFASIAIVIRHIMAAIIALFRLIKPFLETINRAFVRIYRNVVYKIGTLFPIGIRKKLENLLLYSGIAQTPENMLGLTFVYSVVFASIAFVITTLLKLETFFVTLATIGAFLLVWIFVYVVILIIIDKRTESIEKFLPDVLSMISQNMVAGMTPYNAIWAAARPEFGPIATEFQNVARDTLAGISLEEALYRMSERVKSQRLKRVVSLMVQGIRSGGELPKVLQEISLDMQKEQNLIRKLKVETTMQAMFIAFALIIGAPLLFAASLQFIKIFSKIMSTVDVSSLSAMSTTSIIKLSPLPITSEEFYIYSVATLIISGFFGSLLMGIMRTGRLTSASGVSLIPLLIVLSLIVFFLINAILEQFFGAIIT